MWLVAEPLAIHERVQPADAIVVFAGGVGESGEAGEGYRERVRQAVDVFEQGYASQILYISGHTKTFREADIMRALTESLGIPSAHIHTEARVSDTHSYVLRANEICAAQGWDTIVLLTSTYHGRRAQLTFARNAPALRVIYPTVPLGSFYAHRWGITPHQLRGILHEYLGMLYYWWKGWL